MLLIFNVSIRMPLSETSWIPNGGAAQKTNWRTQAQFGWPSSGRLGGHRRNWKGHRAWGSGVIFNAALKLEQIAPLAVQVAATTDCLLSTQTALTLAQLDLNIAGAFIIMPHCYEAVTIHTHTHSHIWKHSHIYYVHFKSMLSLSSPVEHLTRLLCLEIANNQ